MPKPEITDQIQDTYQEVDRKLGPVKLLMLTDGRWFLQKQGKLFEMTEAEARTWLNSRGINPTY